MKNIINLIKFDIKAQKVQLIIEISIIVFLTIQLSIFWSKLPSELIFIPVVSMILIVNSIMLIVKFLKSLGVYLFRANINCFYNYRNNGYWRKY